MLFISCGNSIDMTDKSGNEVVVPTTYVGIIQSMSSVPLNGHITQYTFTIVDSLGNKLKVSKSSMFNFDDETPGMFLMSNLDEGDKVRLEIKGSECNIIKLP